MVDLPSVPRRAVTSQAPQSRLTGADIAGPYRMLADAMGSFVPGIDAELGRRGERAGFERAVTMGDDGLPTVKMAPPLTGAYGEGYDRAAKWKYLADLGPAVDNAVLKAKLEHAGNPAGFQSWASGYAKEMAKRERDPSMRASVEKMVLDSTSAAWRGLATDHQTMVVNGAMTALNTRRAQIENSLFALARNGATDSPEFREAMADYDAIGREIVGNPVFGVSPEVVAEADRKLTGRLAAEQGLGIIVRGDVPRTVPTGDVVSRIIGVESGGDPNAANPDSSAAGLGQFIDETWLTLVKRYRQDIAAGRSNDEILALKTDAALSREMTEVQANENTAALARSGHTASPGNLYLAHFLGPAGASGVLEASADTPVREALMAGGMSSKQADDAISSNRRVLEGKSAGEVRQWARGRMGDTENAASAIEDFFWNPDLDLTPEERRRYVNWAESEVNAADAQRARASGAMSEAHERTIIDAKAGLQPLPPRSVIADDPNLTESARNTLLKAYDAAAGDIVAGQRAYDRFASGGTFNPYEKDDRDALQSIYENLGGDAIALKTVVDQTGIAPPSVVKGLRGGMVSTDPQRVGASLQLASNLIAANPHVFAGHDGGSELETAATTFRHYVDSLGYSADEAAAQIAQANTPEYKAKVAAQVKGEDIGEIVKKNLSADDLRKAFDDSWWPGRPELGFGPAERQGMFSDYATLFRDRYAETGDVALSKTLAQDQLKRVWGVSTVNGSETIMRYPPERAPGMQGLENAGEMIAGQAVDDIRSEMGVEVDRDSLRLMPIPGLTADAFKSGQPVPYMLVWENADGVLQMLNPGRAFVVDGNTLRARQTAARGEAFTERVERFDRLEAAAEREQNRLRGISEGLFGGGDPAVNRTAKTDRLPVVPELSDEERETLRAGQ